MLPAYWGQETRPRISTVRKSLTIALSLLIDPLSVSFARREGEHKDQSAVSPAETGQ